MHQRAALQSGEYGGIEFLAQIGIIGKDHAATWTAQRLVRRGCHNMRMRQRRRMQTGCHQAGKMRHIHVQIGADLVGNRAHAGKIDDPRIGRAAGDQQPGLTFDRLGFQCIIIDQLAVWRNAILHGIEPLARLRCLCAVRQMPSRVQRHAENGFARLYQRQHDRTIGLRTAVRLHIGVGAIEQ